MRMARTKMHFGHNCLHFRLRDHRCETLIERLSAGRYDHLRSRHWVLANRAAGLLGIDRAGLEELVASGELEGRRSKNGILTHVFIDECWGFEVCYLSKTGGCCSDFKAHKGRQIESMSCLIGSAESKPEATGEEPKWTLLP